MFKGMWIVFSYGWFIMSWTTGKPEPEVKWYKNGLRVKPKKKSDKISLDYNPQNDLCILEIKNAAPEDSGDYKVKVVNDFGTVSHKVKVQVGEPLELVKMVEEGIQVAMSEGSAANIDEIRDELWEVKVTEEGQMEKATALSQEAPVREIPDTEVALHVASVPEAVDISEEPSHEVVSAREATTLKTEKHVEADIESRETLEEMVESRVDEGAGTVIQRVTESMKIDKVEEAMGTCIPTAVSDHDGPSITMAPQPVSVSQGEAIILTCKATG